MNSEGMTGIGGQPSGKMRIYELAKELGFQNKEMVDKIRALGISVAELFGGPGGGYIPATLGQPWQLTGTVRLDQHLFDCGAPVLIRSRTTTQKESC